MKAVIMAGGEGKRLRPITCTIPKPMVPLLNKPIIDYALELLHKHGFKDAVITVHYLAKSILEHIGNGQDFGLGITYSDPGLKLGTAGSMKFALCGSSDSVLVLSGDGITDIDLTAFIDTHKKSGADASIVLKSVDEPTEYGVALTDGSGMISRFIEKPELSELFSDYANTGIYIIEPKALDLIPNGVDFDFSKDLFPRMLKKGMKIFGYKTEAYWCDVGSVSEFRRAQYDMLEDKLSFGTNAERINGCFVEKGAEISESAVLMPPCYIGKGAVVGDSAAVGPHTVICSGAVIGKEASLKRSIVLSGSIVRSGAELRESVVCENAQVDASARLYSETVIGAGTTVKSGACVYPNAKIWPDKTIPEGAECFDSVVWGSNRKTLAFSGSSISGYGDSELTPETAVRLGSAIAAGQAQDTSFAVCTDGRPYSVILKSAVSAGINARGLDTYLFSCSSFDCFMYSVRNSGCGFGVYISTGQDRLVSICLIDRSGIPAGSNVLRAVRQAFEEGESKPAACEELGIQLKCEGFEHAYESFLSSFIKENAADRIHPTLFLKADRLSFRIIEKVLTMHGWNVLPGAENIGEVAENQCSIIIEPNGSVSMTLPGVAADDQALLTVMAKRRFEKESVDHIVLPSALRGEYRKLLETLPARIIYSKNDRGALIRDSKSEGADFAEFYDPEAAVIVLCDMFACNELEEELKKLPSETLIERSADILACERGRILRKLSEEKPTDAKQELIDGYRLTFESGWVEIRPETGSRAAFKVSAGSMDSEYAEELCDIYLKKLLSIRDGGNK